VVRWASDVDAAYGTMMTFKADILRVMIASSSNLEWLPTILCGSAPDVLIPVRFQNGPMASDRRWPSVNRFSSLLRVLT
jgi:hypothetical protein